MNRKKIYICDKLNLQLTKYIEIANYTHAELLSALKAGDRYVFNFVYEKYFDTLYNYAYQILADEDECCDALQDVFVWLWNAREKLEIKDFRAYLSAATKFRMISAIRKSKRRESILAQQIPVDTFFLEESIEVKELEELIRSLVDTLPPRAKEIYLLSRKSFLSNKEIAFQLGISEKTVENQMTISLKRIKQGLGGLSFWILFL